MINRIGRYEVQAELGRGGFGRVFRAYDPTVGRLVAIKTLNSSGEADIITRFRNEAAAAGRLRHHNIVIIYDFGEHDGSPFLVMELLEGEDIERIITTQRQITLLKKLDIMTQAASGLHHAHSKGIVHRDIKPANIMLLSDGSVKIMDFGIALLTQATAARITPQGSMIGTLPYMAPEQFYGGDSNILTDIFAYGVTCYKLLTGVHPFHAPEMAGLMYNITNRAPTPIRSLNPECPEALESVINKLLAKDKDARYQTLEDAQFDLDPIIIDLRKENVSELLSRARNLITEDDLENAQQVVRQVIEIDHGNRTARELRETLQRQLKERAVRPQIAALVVAGREQLEERQFDEAIQKFESALRLDKSNTELHALIEQARQARERAERADRLYLEAQQALNRQDLSEAHKSLADALATDPGHTQSEILLSEVRDRVEARRREQHLRDGLNQIKGLMLLQSFSQAIEIATRLKQEHPDSAEAAKLLDKAVREQEALARRQRLQAAVDEAKELLRNRRFKEAGDRLAEAQTQFPEAAELRDLASYAAEELLAEKNAEIISRAAAETRELVAAGSFDAALDRLRQALGENPGLTGLRDLVQSVASQKAEHQRNAALSETIQKTTALSNEGRFSEALEQINSFVRGYGDSSALTLLRSYAEEGLERQRRAAAIRKLILDAQGLLDEGRPGQATQVLHQGTLQFPGDTELNRLLDVARNNLREQQQAEAISQIVSEAESLSRGKKFSQALETVDEGLRRYPNVDRLQRCREAVQASLAAHERERLRREAVERVRQLHGQGRAAEALQAIGAAIADGIEDTGLLALKQQIERELAERRRIEQIRQALEQARSLLDTGRLEPARQFLQDALREYPAEPQFKALMKQADALLLQQQRAEAIATVLRDAGIQAAAQDFENAVRLLDDALRRHGPDEGLSKARTSVLARKATHERQQALVETLARIEEMQAAGRLPQALQAIEAAVKRLGDDPALTARKREVQAAIEVRRRQEEVENALRQARDFLTKNDPSSALPILRKAQTQSPDDPQLAELLATVEIRIREQQRERAIAACADEAAKLRSARQLDKALGKLDAALRQFPGAEVLERLRESVLADQARDRSLELATRLHKEGKLDAAAAEVRRALQSTSGDRELLALQSRIEADQAKVRQAAEIRQAVEQAQALLLDARPDDALALAQRAAAKYPGEKQLSEILGKIEEELQRRRRAKELQDAKAQAETLLSRGRPEEAVALIESRYTNEPLLQDALLRARKEVSARQRDALLRQAGALGQEARYEEAIELLDAGLQRFSADAALVELKRDLETQLESRRRYEEAQNAIRQARDFLANDDPASASRVLQAVQAQSPDNTQVTQLLDIADARIREQQRRQAIAAAVAEAGKLRAAAKFDQALQRLDAALQLFPGVEDLQGLRAAVIADLARVQLLELATRLHREGKLDAASQEIQKGLLLSAGDREFLALQSKVEADQLRQKQAAEIRQAIGQAQSLLQEERLDDARALLQQMAGKYPREKQLSELLANIQAELDRRARAKEVQDAKAFAESLLSQGKPEEAIALIESRFAKEQILQPVLLRAQKEIEARQRAAALQQAAALGQAGRYEEALRQLDAALQRFRGDTALSALRDDLAARLAARKREEEAQAALRQAGDLLAGNDARSAVQLLERALTQASGHAQLTALLASARAKLREQEREQAIADVAAEASKLGADKQFDKALGRLEGALKQFPDAKVLTGLRETILADQARARSLELAARLHQEGKLDAALQEIRRVLGSAPGDREFLNLQSKVEADLEKQRQAAEIRKAIEQAQASVRKDRLEEAQDLLQRTARKYPDERQLSELLRNLEQELEKRRRAKEVQDVRTQAETLLSRGKLEEAITLIEGRYSSEPALQDVLLRARKELDAKRREALIEQSAALGRQGRFEEALRIVADAVRQYGPSVRAGELERGLQAGLAEQLRRKAREAARTQLLAIEQQLATGLRKRKIVKLDAEAQTIAAQYRDDPEISQIARRISQTALAVPEKKGLSPTVMVGGGLGIAALIGGIAFFFHSSTPPVTPVVAEVPVEIRSDPPGASVQFEGRSCVTPNCRFPLKPGQYQLEAKLDGYQVLHQAVNVAPTGVPPTVDLKLEPVPTPPPAATTGTLIVATGVPDALVYIDNSPRIRTDQSGSATVALEARTYQVRVERNGYEKLPARQVKIDAGGRETASFTLVPEVARLELRGAPRGVEVRVGGKLLGRTDGSPAFDFPTPLTPGDQSLQITLDAANRTVQRKFEGGQIARLDWKDVAPAPPPPNADAIDRQDWDRVKTSSDVAQLRVYLSNHPNGLHARDAASRVADLIWKAVDPNNIDAVRRFARENPDNVHRPEAQNIIDKYDAEQQRLAQIRAKQEQAKADQAKADQARAEQAKAEQARLEQAKLEQARAEQAKLEQARQDHLRKQPVLDLLNQMAAVLRRKNKNEVKEFWSGAGKLFVDSVGTAGVEMSMVPREQDIQFPQGPDQAVAQCDLTVKSPLGSKLHRASFVLRNVGGAWRVDQLKVD